MWIVFLHLRSKMTLNYRVIVERHTSPNEMIGGLIPTVKSFLYLTWKLARWAGSQEPTHHGHKVDNKPHHAPRGLLSMVGPTCSNSRRIARCWLFIYWFLTPIVEWYTKRLAIENKAQKVTCGIGMRAHKRRHRCRFTTLNMIFSVWYTKYERIH
jgi:hypothetical protein